MWLDWIFPRRCLHCREFLKSGGDLCPACAAAWPSLESPYCSVCARPFVSSEGSSRVCGDCLREPKVCARVIAAGVYRGVLHDLIVRFKYRGQERYSGFFGAKMAEVLVAVPDSSYDVIVPAPLHPARLRERGYNQSHLLAREVGKALRLPVIPRALKKVRKTPPQADLPAEERRKNLRGAFEVREAAAVKGKRVLIVDDVYTTGATVETISGLLLRNGAERVEALVLARAD